MAARTSAAPVSAVRVQKDEGRVLEDEGRVLEGVDLVPTARQVIVIHAAALREDAAARENPAIEIPSAEVQALASAMADQETEGFVAAMTVIIVSKDVRIPGCPRLVPIRLAIETVADSARRNAGTVHQRTSNS